MHLQKTNMHKRNITCHKYALDVVNRFEKKSKYFGKHKLIKLSSAENHQIYMPSGFAHGYLTLSKIAKVEYLCSNFIIKLNFYKME